MKNRWIILFIVALVMGCGMKTGIIERLGITAVAQKFGVEFKKHNPDLAIKAVKYLDGIDKMEGIDDLSYARMIEAGVNAVYQTLDQTDRAIFKPFVDQLIIELSASPVEISDYIRLPADLDYLALKAAVGGFKSGLILLE